MMPSEEEIEAAAKAIQEHWAIYGRLFECSCGYVPPEKDQAATQASVEKHIVEISLTAALPAIEKHVRAQVAADPLPGLEGTDLNRKVRDEIYRQLSGHYGDFAVPTPKEAQAVIDAVAGHLLNAVPDDSADDVREALGI